MSLNANLRPRVTFENATRVKRVVPGKGQISIKEGSNVESGDILASAEVTLGFHLLNLASSLGVPKSFALKYLQRPIGQKIFKGELLASRGNLFGKKNILAPTDAIVDSYSKETGELRLKYLPKNVSITSGVYGVVEKIDPLKGEITIKTIATMVHGLIGVGRERGGVLVINGEAGSLLTAGKITSDLHQKIIVGGALIYGDAFEKAAIVGVAGILTGGINLKDYKALAGDYDLLEEAVLDPELSVLGTEGFGSMPIGDDIFNTLKEHSGRFAFLNGKKRVLLLPSNSPDSIMKLRKISLPPEGQSNGSESQVNFGQIKEGTTVRIVWPPFAGYQGKVVAIDKTATTLPSGIPSYQLTVETKSRKIKVPFQNVEMII